MEMLYLFIVDSKYILLPELNQATGELIRDLRSLSYQAVNIGGGTIKNDQRQNVSFRWIGLSLHMQQDPHCSAGR